MSYQPKPKDYAEIKVPRGMVDVIEQVEGSDNLWLCSWTNRKGEVRTGRFGAEVLRWHPRNGEPFAQRMVEDDECD